MHVLWARVPTNRSQWWCKPSPLLLTWLPLAKHGTTRAPLLLSLLATGYKTGTSQSTPFVAGAAALLLAASNGRLAATELRQLLMDSAEPSAGLQGKVTSGVRERAFCSAL